MSWRAVVVEAVAYWMEAGRALAALHRDVLIGASSLCYFALPITLLSSFIFFFLKDPAPPEIYPLPLHDALPISRSTPDILNVANAAITQNVSRKGKTLRATRDAGEPVTLLAALDERDEADFILEEIKARQDRKSTRLNSSHSQISYAVFCLKKKK